MLIARKIIFYLFLVIYCILCPILIMYLFGYIWNPLDKGIAQTGLIQLETIPAGADIFLGKSRYKYKTPASITNLFPGKYQITIKLKGHRLWAHEVSIEEGQASAFKNIILLPKKLNPNVLSLEPDHQNIILLPETNSFIIKKSPQLEGFFIFDCKKEQLRPLLKNYPVYADFTVSKIYHQTDGKKIVIYGGSLWNKRFYLIDLEDKDQYVADITKLFDGMPDELIWDTAYKNNCFALYGDYINRLDLKAMSVYPRFIEDIKGFGGSDKWLYVLGKDNRISKMALDEPQHRVLFEDRNFGKGLFSKSSFYEIQFLEEDSLLFLGDKGDLITALPSYYILQSQASGVNFHKRSQKLLFWSKNTIRVADFSKETVKQSLSSDRIIVKTVYEQGENILQCFWAYHGTHIIFRGRDRVFLLELLPDGKHHMEFLTNVKNNSDVFYSDETGSLYYLDLQGRAVSQKIIPKEFMIFAPLLEPGKTKEELNEL